MGQEVPDRKWRELHECLKSNTRPQDKFLSRVYDVVSGKKKDKDIDEALTLINTPFSRDIMVALFLIEALAEDISDCVGVKSEVARITKALILDDSVFRNRLERIAYIQHYCENIASEQGLPYMEIAIEGGARELSYSLKVGDRSIEDFNPTAIVKKMVQTCNAHSFVLRFNPSKDAQEMMLKFMTTGHRMLSNFEKVNRDAPASTEALAALETQRESVTLDDLGIDKDQLLH